MDKFQQDIQRIQSEQIGRGIHVQSERKVAESQFRDEFKRQLGLDDAAPDALKFSNHAIARLQKRNIDVSMDALDRINNAFSKAEEKGARESLIMVDDLAFIVSVKNKTVVTAMDRPSMRDQVITNIDSAVIG